MGLQGVVGITTYYVNRPLKDSCYRTLACSSKVFNLSFFRLLLNSGFFLKIEKNHIGINSIIAVIAATKLFSDKLEQDQRGNGGIYYLNNNARTDAPLSRSWD